jgi:hypothetical protein
MRETNTQTGAARKFWRKVIGHARYVMAGDEFIIKGNGENIKTKRETNIIMTAENDKR